MQNEKCRLQSEDAGNAIIHSAFLRAIGVSIRTIPPPTPPTARDCDCRRSTSIARRLGHCVAVPKLNLLIEFNTV